MVNKRLSKLKRQQGSRRRWRTEGARYEKG